MEQRIKRPKFKTKYYLNITSNNTFKWWRFVKFRGANCMDVYFLGLKINYGLPYLHRFIYQKGWDDGFSKTI